MSVYENTIREAIEESIRKKLEDPSITAEDIEHLAKAYSELHKDDNIKLLMEKNLFNGIGGSYNGPSQLETKHD